MIPGRNGGVKPFGVCGARQLFAIQGWISNGSLGDARYFDLGAIVLDCEVGLQTGWFALKSKEHAGQADTTIHGYPCDKAPVGRQWVSRDIIRHREHNKIFYQNDTYGCMSGSPVFLDDDKQSVAAIHTNGLHGEDPWKSNNAATDLTDQRVRILEELIRRAEAE